MAIVRRLSLKVIDFWKLPSITKISEPFEKLLEVLSDDIFDAEEKPDTFLNLGFLGKIKGKALWDNKIWYCNSKTSIVGSY